RGALPLMERRGGGSILTLTYLGSDLVFPNYNVMGVAKAALESSVRYLAADLGPKNIRVNAISAGPIKTLAASGVGGFKSMLKTAGDMTPLKRNVSQDEVGSTATYLASSWSSGVTGEIIFVDAGANIVGMYFDEKKAEGPSPTPA
ncbi:MAG TPA: SDR family oxidoreductase, partial [bacterium]